MQRLTSLGASVVGLGRDNVQASSDIAEQRVRYDHAGYNAAQVLSSTEVWKPMPWANGRIGSTAVGHRKPRTLSVQPASRPLF
ncbi:MAG: hypothetical protein DDT26_01582 [Dehalococcoidia bacterium]|nr:hypothetical protein [Chloroflexota bacterium]